jgi:hypothetical protein
MGVQIPNGWARKLAVGVGTGERANDLREEGEIIKNLQQNQLHLPNASTRGDSSNAPVS